MRISTKILSSFAFASIIFLNGVIYSQGPTLSFFYDANTNLPYASCQLSFENGATLKIPFLPVVNVKGAPCGINRYTRDINITASLTFIGNGIYKQGLYDCYKGVSVNGRMALYCYDFPDSISQLMKEKITNKSRIDEAISRGASGIVLFSYTDLTPSLPYWEMDENKVPEIPMISINKESIEAIFRASGIDSDKLFKKWEEGSKVFSKELDVNMNIKIVGQFGHVESKNFIYAYQKPGIKDSSMHEIIKLNERSVNFLLDLFSSEKVSWKKSFTCYFRDYDSKVFYKRAWGKANSGINGTFTIYNGETPEYFLIVHENTHTLTETNWGKSTSFMNEGFAMYAEALAGKKNNNHEKVHEFIKQEKLLPLKDMVGMNIGTDEGTHIAYYASGSFVGFLIEKYGLSKTKDAYIAEGKRNRNESTINSWNSVYKKSLFDLEIEWVNWLESNSDFDTK